MIWFSRGSAPAKHYFRRSPTTAYSRFLFLSMTDEINQPANDDYPQRLSLHLWFVLEWWGFWIERGEPRPEGGCNYWPRLRLYVWNTYVVVGKKDAQFIQSLNKCLFFTQVWKIEVQKMTGEKASPAWLERCQRRWSAQPADVPLLTARSR